MRSLCLLPLLATGCAAVAAPPCVALSPHHETRGGIAEAGVVAGGETVEEVLDWEATPWSDLATDALTVEWHSEPQNDDSSGACAFDLSCDPDEIEPSGRSHLTCAVSNDVTFDACTFRTLITVNVTAFDSGVCTDAPCAIG